MTAEIAILNKSAVALAADSAVTVDAGSEKKIFTTANKLFMLSKYHPVGIMVYGTATFMDVAWETIVKTYRQRLADRQFANVQGYARDFLKYLVTCQFLRTPTQLRDFVDRIAFPRFTQIRNEINRAVELYLKTNPSISPRQIRSITQAKIADALRTLTAKRLRVGLSGRRFQAAFVRSVQKAYSKQLDRVRKYVFEKLPLTSSDRSRLAQIVVQTVAREGDLPYSSGVVFAGYGRLDMFPSLFSYEVFGILAGKLIYKQRGVTKVSVDMTAAIVPFAQREMVHAFMEGVDPYYQEFLQQEIQSSTRSVFEAIAQALQVPKGSKLSKALTKIRTSMVENYLNRLNEYRDKYHSEPVVTTVASLPKPELAAMAESLINLTSFKRRMSPEAETVGGPIDVAVISRGDGFVWIHRKHYFEAAINHHFFDNYYKEFLNA